MTGYKPRVISLTKRPGQTFGFFLRVEHEEEGHLIRCLEMGGPAELAGLRDGDRILRVNGNFVDALPHSQVVDLVKESGATVTFHILDETSYKQAKAQKVDLSDLQFRPAANGVAGPMPKPKLCYLVKSNSGYGFGLRSAVGEPGLFMTDVTPGSVADKAGVKVNDRLLEVNGENVDAATHDIVVEKIKLAGNSIMFLLVDKETDRYYQNKHIRLGAGLATIQFLPHKPRIIKMTKGHDGYGFLLREEPSRTGHFIRDIDRKSPAERAGLKDMDRLVAVDGQEVDGLSHEQVVDMVRKSGNKCCLLVVDEDTDKVYKMGGVSPILYWEEMRGCGAPPSYTEAVHLPPVVRPTKPVKEKKEEEELKPKLCKMEKTSAGYGFHLNGILGVCGQYIKEVVKGGVADRAGLEDDDIVVEVNGVNVEKSTHEEVVALIRNSGSSLDLLVATKIVYNQLKTRGVAITSLLLGQTSSAQVHAPATLEEKVRPETPPVPARERTPSVSSASSQGSFDDRF
ncbi:Na(+)/H(+) exchange regulatory cofactor NHE-RF3 [Lampris incognitus]|uniref:Na(+)/H(+) exchange regulatory cofactor NHE-RF3 n=1 Tax=Lampris incognitus TaxID=2546036 RepID=UPI0024B5D84D|nr:Na(+)/H(+) exchange regulatory cofactor NHE-RF3 [Lampris incognitus]